MGVPVQSLHIDSTVRKLPETDVVNFFFFFTSFWLVSGIKLTGSVPMVVFSCLPFELVLFFALDAMVKWQPKHSEKEFGDLHKSS